MTILTNLSVGNVQSPRENLFKIFSFVKGNADKILEEYTNVCFSENPFVDIETIAKSVGIIDIQKVLPEDIDYEHAQLRDKIILVNGEDPIEEQRFSIAHEIYHFMCTEKEAARSVANPELEIWKSHKRNTGEDLDKEIATATSKEFGKFISGLIGKAISEKTEKIVFEKIGKKVFELMAKNAAKVRETISNETNFSIFQEIVNAISEVIFETVDEEIADYFAANLIVPTERFILWEDKQNKEIARAFKVAEDCIRKRREEIENELYFMAPKNLSSGIEIEKTALLSHDEMDSILEGYSTNVAGRG
jgi:Zn-dependent peptidase ImmA (M78 family)